MQTCAILTSSCSSVFDHFTTPNEYAEVETAYLLSALIVFVVFTQVLNTEWCTRRKPWINNHKSHNNLAMKMKLDNTMYNLYGLHPVLCHSKQYICICRHNNSGEGSNKGYLH